MALKNFQETGVPLTLNTASKDIPDTPQSGEVSGIFEETKRYYQPFYGLMPDPTIGFDERNSNVYTNYGVLPLNRDRALELFDKGHEIYQIYGAADDVHALEIDVREQIEKYDGIFGVDVSAWLESAEYTEMLQANKNREAEFLNGGGDAYAVYLFNPDSSDARISKENYTLAYVGELKDGDTPDSIRERFSGTKLNINTPDGFQIEKVETVLPQDYRERENGRGFGTGDIIAMK